MFLATLLTSAVLIIQQVFLMGIFVVGAPTIGKEAVDVPAYLNYADLISLIPVVVATVGLLWLMKKRSLSREPATPRVQAVYITTFGVSYVLLLAMNIWEAIKPSPYGTMDFLSVIASMLIPMLIPAVVFLITYMLAKKTTPAGGRVFVGLLYTTIAVFVSVSFGAGLMLLSQLNSAVISMDAANYGSMLASAASFIGIIIWHKIRRAS
jgi:hypothetical protein